MIFASADEFILHGHILVVSILDIYTNAAAWIVTDGISLLLLKQRMIEEMADGLLTGTLGS
jgi:hypothetical protein